MRRADYVFRNENRFIHRMTIMVVSMDSPEPLEVFECNFNGHTMYETISLAKNVIRSSFLEFGTPELDLRHATSMWKIHEKVRF